MNREEARTMGLVLLVALKHSTPEETEVILGCIHDAEEVSEKRKIGFNLPKRKGKKAPTAEKAQ